jgi:outer membrane biosynthesis protein TonB
MQISGTVKVEAVVGPNGRVKSTKVIGGSPVLTKAALDAIGVWKWAGRIRHSGVKWFRLGVRSIPVDFDSELTSARPYLGRKKMPKN